MINTTLYQLLYQFTLFFEFLLTELFFFFFLTISFSPFEAPVSAPFEASWIRSMIVILNPLQTTHLHIEKNHSNHTFAFLVSHLINPLQENEPRTDYYCKHNRRTQQGGSSLFIFKITRGIVFTPFSNKSFTAEAEERKREKKRKIK